jgi:hypothetical protein
VVGGVLLLEDYFRLRPDLWDRYRLSDGPAGSGPASPSRRQPPAPLCGWAGLDSVEVRRRVAATARRLRAEFGPQVPTRKRTRVRGPPRTLRARMPPPPLPLPACCTLPPVSAPRTPHAIRRGPCPAAGPARPSLTRRAALSGRQLAMSGTCNAWVLKPGHGSRGRGVRCYDDLQLIIQAAAGRTRAAVVQKSVPCPCPCPLSPVPLSPVPCPLLPRSLFHFPCPLPFVPCPLSPDFPALSHKLRTTHRMG